MATLSLQDILATEPGLAAKIDAMTELIPGVPASKQNLKTLLEHLMKEGSFHLGGTDDTSIEFLVAKHKKKKEFMVQVLGKAEMVRRADLVFNQRPCVCSEVFKCTEEGLLESLYTPSRTGNDTGRMDLAQIATARTTVSLRSRN